MTTLPVRRSDDFIHMKTIFAAFAIRLAMLCTEIPEILRRRVEVATPLSSLLRLTEGKWLLRHGLSPYAGSSYHGSPLLLAVPGSDSVWPYLVADLLSAFLLHSLGVLITPPPPPHASESPQGPITAAISSQEAASKPSLPPPPIETDPPRNSESVKIIKGMDGGEGELLGRWAALLYLLNPLSIAACVGGSNASLENMLILTSLCCALAGRPSLAALGWTLSTWLALYPALLLLPISLLLLHGRDNPKSVHQNRDRSGVRWRQLASFATWCVVWWVAGMGLSWWTLRDNGGLSPFFTESWGFVVGVRDLNPTIGVSWYFFTEMFPFFRPLYLFVFPAIPAVLLAPLGLRLHRRPLFLAFVLLALTSIIKPYPSVADAALYLALLPLFVLQLQDMRFTYVLITGFLYVYVIGPIMFNLWIWQGTGNANFYYAVGMVYVCVQSMLVVESVNAMLGYDRNLKYQLSSKHE